MAVELLLLVKSVSVRGAGAAENELLSGQVGPWVDWEWETDCEI